MKQNLFTMTVTTALITSTLVAISLFLTGCGQGTPPSQEPEEPGAQVIKSESGVQLKFERQTSLNPDLSNIEAYKRDLNRYTAQLTMPTELAERIQITRVHVNKKALLHVDTTPFQYENGYVTLSETIDISGEPIETQKFRYELVLDEETLKPLEFAIKPDVLIQGIKKLSELSITNKDLDLGTLFIDENSAFLTEGADLSIHAAIIIAQRGTLGSFTQEFADAVAAVGKPGRCGGHISISTDFFIGDLEIAMRGTRGGKGIDGLDETTSPPKAEPGSNSSDRQNCYRGLARKIQPLSFHETIREIEPCNWICAQEATNGKAGAQGLPGKNGNPGMKGGDSGAVNFFARKLQGQPPTVISSPGLGGEVSLGGKGGPGGLGGDPGTIKNSLCKAALSGAQGQPGEPGKPGPKGVDGEKQNSCLQFNQQEKTC